MPATFSGTDLTITLPSSGGTGAVNIDVEADLYSDWKEWVLAGNAQYPIAFDTAAGDPLTDTTDAAGYFFLRNDNGWRIKPAEEDVDYYFTGNLIPRDSLLPVQITTTGAYTTAIFGLQLAVQVVETSVSGLTAEESDWLSSVPQIETDITAINTSISNIEGDITTIQLDIATSAALMVLLQKYVENKKELLKTGDVWEIIIYDNDNVTPILRKVLKDTAGNNITDPDAGVMALEEASSV